MVWQKKEDVKSMFYEQRKNPYVSEARSLKFPKREFHFVEEDSFAE